MPLLLFWFFIVFAFTLCYTQETPANSPLQEAPTNINKDTTTKYVKVNPETGFKFQIDFYCYQDDPRSCLMYDKKGNLAGIQISFVKDQFSNVVSSDYDFASNPNYLQTNFFNIPAYSFRVYYTNPEKLTEEGMAEVEEMGVWVYLEGKLNQISTKLSIPGDTINGFNKQKCMPTTGTTYFYKIDTESKCDKLFPLFLMYEKEHLVGYGLVAFGEGGIKVRDWYDRPESLKDMIQSRPTCMEKLETKYGLTMMKVYFLQDPSKITC